MSTRNLTTQEYYDKMYSEIMSTKYGNCTAPIPNSENPITPEEIFFEKFSLQNETFEGTTSINTTIIDY